MANEDKIQEILETQQKILGQLDNIRMQQGIFESRFKSELGKDGTFERIHFAYDKELKRLDDLIYNRDTGLAFEIDRLKIKDKNREKWIFGLLIPIVLLVVKLIIDLINKK